MSNNQSVSLNRRQLVAAKRGYRVLTVADAKEVAKNFLKEIDLLSAIHFGLPEIDDRYHIWRVPIRKKGARNKIGEIVIDAMTSLVIEGKTTDKALLEARLLGRDGHEGTKVEIEREQYRISPLRNTVAFGDSKQVLDDMPAESIDLIFTSPPYYNAKPEYSDYYDYEEYLLSIRKVIQKCRRVLADGRFFVMNTSPVLVRRASRNEASKRIGVPFDIHRIFVEEGFDFVDDIIWQKPEGAGWATGRGRRFAADRNPMQYKPVPVTEYVLVYRKRSNKLIDWFIRNHPDKRTINQSKIGDGYEKTNIWKIHPAHSKLHPAIFPLELAKRVIQYYSFKNDVVLDPYAGLGTVGEAAVILQRRFVLVEINKEYIEHIRRAVKIWMGKDAQNVLWINGEPVGVDDILL